MFSIYERIMMGLVVLMLIAALLLIPFAVKRQADFEVACKEAGGVPFTSYKSYNLCVNPSAIVELK